MFCKNNGCGNLISREEARKNKGLCNSCIETENSERKVTNDLLTAFGGKGKRGFVQWLKLGKFLCNIEDEADIHAHNDRVNTIRLLVGGERKFDKILDGFANVVLGIAREETANE